MTGRAVVRSSPTVKALPVGRNNALTENGKNQRLLKGEMEKPD
jgi:hypothetical protein